MIPSDIVAAHRDHRAQRLARRRRPALPVRIGRRVWRLLPEWRLLVRPVDPLVAEVEEERRGGGVVLHDAHGRPRVVVGVVVAVLDDVGRRSVVVPEVAVPHEQALASGQLDRAMADKIRLVVVLGAAQVPHVRDIAAVDRQVVGGGVPEVALPDKVAGVARGFELLDVVRVNPMVLLHRENREK